MEHRRYFGFRPPRPIGDSTILVPQLENYSLFAAPFLDLKKKIGKSTEEVSIMTRKRTKEEEEKRLAKETSEADYSFGIVLNFATVKPKHLAISFGEGNEIEVKVDQDMVESECGSIPFSRNCTYTYQLPDGVDKETLVALWTSDDYFIILPKDELRGDLLKTSLGGPEESAEKDVDDASTTGTSKTDESSERDVDDASKTGTSKTDGKQKKTFKGDKSKVSDKGSKESILEETSEKDVDDASKTGTSKTDGKQKKPSKGDESKVSDKGSKESILEESEKELAKNSVIPVHRVTRMLRPGMDIFMLRKYMVDLESYVSMARKLVENASFLMHNSKSAERCIRHLATQRTNEFYEEPNLKSNTGRKMKPRPDVSPENGYTSKDKVSLKR